MPEGTRVACAIVRASIAERRTAYERGAITVADVSRQRHCWIVGLFGDLWAWCKVVSVSMGADDM
jgi:hypothetical protein